MIQFAALKACRRVQVTSGLHGNVIINNVKRDC